jgi:hypothetical protein
MCASVRFLAEVNNTLNPVAEMEVFLRFTEEVFASKYGALGSFLLQG